MSAQRMHHKSPSSTTIKQGPLKATLPVVSLYKQQGTTIRKSKSNSPTLSPTSTWKARSPDQSGQRSPGSYNYCYKVKSKTLSGGGCTSSNSILRDDDLDDRAVIRRTASLDTIYLKGQWPRDCFYMFNNSLQIDKATQTDDNNLDVRKRYVEPCTNNDRNTDDKLKMIRHRLQRNTQCVITRDRTVSATAGGALHGDHTVQLTSSSQTVPITKASPVNIPVKPLTRPPMRSSIEGLNQEIEGLVLKANTGVPGALFTDRSDDDKFQLLTPEGHRAPLAEMLRSTRSVNTQTPAPSDCLGSCNSSGGSQGSSPDQECGKFGTSPHINRFLAREPPDGCEKVNLKFIEESARRSAADISPLKPNVTFQLKPSQGSAFYPLQQLPSPPGDSPVLFVPPEAATDLP